MIRVEEGMNLRRSYTKANGTVTVAIRSRVDSENKSLGACCLSTGKDLLGHGIICSQIDL